MLQSFVFSSPLESQGKCVPLAFTGVVWSESSVLAHPAVVLTAGANALTGAVPCSRSPIFAAAAQSPTATPVMGLCLLLSLPQISAAH